MIQQIDESKDAAKEKVVDVPGVTRQSQLKPSRLQFLNRVNDVQGVLLMHAERRTNVSIYGESRAGD